MLEKWINTQARHYYQSHLISPDAWCVACGIPKIPTNPKGFQPTFTLRCTWSLRKTDLRPAPLDGCLVTEEFWSDTQGLFVKLNLILTSDQKETIYVLVPKFLVLCHLCRVLICFWDKKDKAHTHTKKQEPRLYSQSRRLKSLGARADQRRMVLTVLFI